MPARRLEKETKRPTKPRWHYTHIMPPRSLARHSCRWTRPRTLVSTPGPRMAPSPMMRPTSVVLLYTRKVGSTLTSSFLLSSLKVRMVRPASCNLKTRTLGEKWAARASTCGSRTWQQPQYGDVKNATTGPSSLCSICWYSATERASCRKGPVSTASSAPRAAMTPAAPRFPCRRGRRIGKKAVDASGRLLHKLARTRRARAGTAAEHSRAREERVAPECMRQRSTAGTPRSRRGPCWHGPQDRASMAPMRGPRRSLTISISSAPCLLEP
mmetsp:Transcript_44233/g.99711  ORF Transcript_44233/g.99711 Transcript_44233/m.99711 type:complete len:270 (-) Transcript_44233:8-817(-)